jgi:6-pyruvoyltetrahydropterin/6-carboxytetrahydropterin synthase
MQTIKVKHEIQMAHRLPNLPGKCQNIHGHTWTVILTISGKVDGHGILIDYTELKAVWREYLDTNFDHRFCVWQRDPLLMVEGPYYTALDYYPGLKAIPVDPTVENLSRIFGEAAQAMFENGKSFGRTFVVELWEGNTNCATWEST